MENRETTVEEYIAEFMVRARKAQKSAECLTQDEVDELAAAITWEFVTNDELLEELAAFWFNECRMGDIPSKIIKVKSKCRGEYYDVKNQKTVGIVEEIPEKGLVRIVKPVGVIASLVPSTQGELHPVLQAINAVKQDSRNSDLIQEQKRRQLKLSGYCVTYETIRCTGRFVYLY